jgi:hypothetical protein
MGPIPENVLKDIEEKIIEGDDAHDTLVGCGIVAGGIHVCYRSDPSRWFRLTCEEITEQIKAAFSKGMDDVR